MHNNVLLHSRLLTIGCSLVLKEHAPGKLHMPPRLIHRGAHMLVHHAYAEDAAQLPAPTPQRQVMVRSHLNPYANCTEALGLHRVRDWNDTLQPPGARSLMLRTQCIHSPNL